MQFERRTEASASARLLRPDSCASSEGRNGPGKGIKGAKSRGRDSSSDKGQKSQYRLAFPEESRGAAGMVFEGGAESELAKRKAGSAATEQWMEEVCEGENCKQELRRVKANTGSVSQAGAMARTSTSVDGLEAEETGNDKISGAPQALRRRLRKQRGAPMDRGTLAKLQR
ncbi:MAG TPA: hypothetical protein VIX37_22180 [Candidatus Sulfotelmatobacter sp.]